MSKLKFSFLVLMLMVSVSASADWAPADVQAALKKMYPTVDDVAWSHDESYYVADFLMNGFDTKVWFDGQAQWVMQQTDWETMDEVPPAVYNAFAASEYSGGMVQNVTWVQFPKCDRLHVQAHRLPGAGGRAFHRRASGGVGQEVLYRPVGGHDHPPGAAERPGDRGIPDLRLLCAHPGADYSVCHPEQPCKTGGLHPADAPNRGAGRGCWQRDLRGGGGAPGTD